MYVRPSRQIGYPRRTDRYSPEIDTLSISGLTTKAARMVAEVVRLHLRALTSITMTPIDAQIAELQRELNVRMRVYPRWINFNKITRRDADHRKAVLADAIKSLRELQEIKHGKQEKLKL